MWATSTPVPSGLFGSGQWKALAWMESRKRVRWECLILQPPVKWPFATHCFLWVLAVPSCHHSSKLLPMAPTPGYCAISGWFLCPHLCRQLLDYCLPSYSVDNAVFSWDLTNHSFLFLKMISNSLQKGQIHYNE